ncbi:MAG: hypothetical protein RSB77_00655 [Bacilli bacterium]
MIDIKKEELKAKVYNYLKIYGDLYPEGIKELIEKEYMNKPEADVFMELYATLDLYKPEENPYKGIANIIENKFGVDNNILEIAGGCYPTLGEEIDKRQAKINKGTITVYDPCLLMTNLGNIKLHKENFYFLEKPEQYDTLVGVAPCSATISLIENAMSKGKNLLVSPCSCPHFPSWYEPGLYDDEKEWFRYVYNVIRMYDNNQGKLETEYLETSYDYRYPVYTYKMK